MRKETYLLTKTYVIQNIFMQHTGIKKYEWYISPLYACQLVVQWY